MFSTVNLVFLPVSTVHWPLDVAAVRQKLVQHCEARGRFQVTEAHDEDEPGTREETKEPPEEQEGREGGESGFYNRRQTPPQRTPLLLRPAGPGGGVGESQKL